MDIRRVVAEEIVRSGWLESRCKSVCTNRSLVDDLMQEILVIILEFKTDSTFYRAYAEGNHLPFIKKIITNQWQSSSSQFYYKYRKFTLEELNQDYIIEGNE